MLEDYIFCFDNQECVQIKKINPLSNVKVFKPPYFDIVKKNNMDNILIIVPLIIFSNENILDRSFKLLDLIIKNYKNKKIRIRFHPREKKDNINNFFSKIKLIEKNLYIINHQVEGIIKSVEKASVVIGGSSGALRIAALSNLNINVFGIEDFVTKSFWGKPISLGDTNKYINWVDENFDFMNIKKNNNKNHFNYYENWDNFLVDL